MSNSGKLSKMNFVHPECGDFTDIEREMLFLLNHRPGMTYISILMYLVENVGWIIPDILKLTIQAFENIGIIVREQDFFSRFSLTAKGEAYVDAMEAGGW